MELLPGLHSIDVPLGQRLSRLYLFVGSRRTLLFDAGCDGDISAHLLPYLDSIGVAMTSVEFAVVSHCDADHFGGLADAKEALPAVTALAHALDAPMIADKGVFMARRGREFAELGVDESPESIAWLERVVRSVAADREVQGDERIDLGGREVQILHLPGHSLGHLAIADPANAALVISDAILGDAVPFLDGSPAFPPTYRYLDTYLQSVDRVAAMQWGHLFTAHYPLFDRSAGLDFIDRTRSFASLMHATLLETLGALDAPATLGSLLATINPVVGSWPMVGTESALAFPVMAHLDQLLDKGTVRRRAHVGPDTFELAT